MPSYMCVVCQISSKFVKRRNLNISFHGFPSDPDKRQAWAEFCGTQSGPVCSEHFANGCFMGGRDEKNKRRRLIGWGKYFLWFICWISFNVMLSYVLTAVPTIRFPANSFEEMNSSYDTIHSENSNSFDSPEELDTSEAYTISTQHHEISQLRSQVENYKTQVGACLYLLLYY